MYPLEREQLVTARLEESWNFLKNPENLKVITPPDLDFRIISPVPQGMYNAAARPGKPDTPKAVKSPLQLQFIDFRARIMDHPG